jgi:hypothetical protein
LKRKAKKMGVTPASYVRQLIEDDLELDDIARTTAFNEIAAPFRQAMANISDEELDRRVDAARTRHHQKTAKRKR